MAAYPVTVAIAILIIINVLIACLTIIVAYNVLNENGGFKITELVGLTSIMCDDLSMHPDDDFETFDEVKNLWKVSVNKQGQYVCGIHNITHIVDKVVEKHLRLRLASGLDGLQYMSCGNKSLIPKSGELTAYFTRASRHTNSTDIGVQSKVYWDLSHSFIHPNITYNDGEVTIPEGRTYFVYASVTFNLSQIEHPVKNRPNILTLRVIRKTYGYERTLLGKTEVYTNGIGNIVTSLNVASNVLLQRDDILLVRVSSEECLHQHSKGNTFGLFPI